MNLAAGIAITGLFLALQGSTLAYAIHIEHRLTVIEAQHTELLRLRGG